MKTNIVSADKKKLEDCLALVRVSPRPSQPKFPSPRAMTDMCTLPTHHDPCVHADGRLKKA